MRYKILVLKNGPGIDVADECNNATAFFASRPTPIYVEFSFKEINVPVDYKVYKTVQGFNSENGQPMLVDYYGLVDSVKDSIRPLVPEGQYNSVMFISDVSKIPVVPGKSYPNFTNFLPLYFNTGFMQVVFNNYLKQRGEVANAIKHEPMHDFCFTLNRYGYHVLDEMDLDHLGRPYYRNDFPEDIDSNFGETFANMEPYVDKLYGNDIIIGMTPLKLGSKGIEVIKLQKALGIATDGIFGKDTLSAVKSFQASNGLISDGIVGIMTASKLNLQQTGSKIALWVEAGKQMEGAKPERNNPGNLRFVGQQFAVNDNGFCKFDTYQHGYDAFKNLLVNACSGKSSTYNPDMTLYDFYNKYAPASDGNDPKHYAEFVATKIGVPPTIQIKNLL